MRITKRSALTGKVHTLEIDITPEQVEQWQAGGMIQDVCPHLSVSDREFLISGSTQEEWDKFFGKGNV
jgi:Na+-transporting NADH:ubiquinone oxidoreductase subunit NqrF